MANAEWPKMTPNMQKHRIAFIDRKSLDKSDFELESAVNLYQFRGKEKLTRADLTGKKQNRKLLIILIGMSSFVYSTVAELSKPENAADDSVV